MKFLFFLAVPTLVLSVAHGAELRSRELRKNGNGSGTGTGGNGGGGGGGGRGQRLGNSNGALMFDTIMEKEDLDDAERADLLYMREEEKMARDLYRAFYKEFDLKIFNNIAQSEQHHMDMIKAKMDAEGIQEEDDPARGKADGFFTNEAIQALYNDMLETGLLSPTKALEMGAKVEEVDITDLEISIEEIEDKDSGKPGLKALYENLMSASNNHLKAFARVLNNLGGGQYKAQYMSQDNVNAILGV